MAQTIAAALDDKPPVDAAGMVLLAAESPGIRDLSDSTNPGGEAQELARLAGALTLAWTRRRLPIMARLGHQPATMIMAVSRHQPANDRPDSRLFDILIDEETVLLERFVVGQRWGGFRFNCPLLYYWRTTKEGEVSWQKPTTKAMCYEPTSLTDWIERLEKMDDDPIGKVILGGKTITWPDPNIKLYCELAMQKKEPLPDEWMGVAFPQYFHSCRGCEYDDICFGPEPFPADATEAYPGLFKRRESDEFKVSELVQRDESEAGSGDSRSMENTPGETGPVS